MQLVTLSLRPVIVFLSMPIYREYIIMEFQSHGINFISEFKLKITETLKNLVESVLMKHVLSLIKSVQFLLAFFSHLSLSHTLTLYK